MKGTREQLINNIDNISVVYQGETSECGLACIIMLLNALGKDENLVSMRSKYKLSSRGLSLSDMEDIFIDYNVETFSIKFEKEFIHSVPLPCILHVGGNHFVLVKESSGSIFHVYDPAMGEQYIHKNILASYASGFALIVSDEMEISQDYIPGKKSGFLGFIRPKISTFLLISGMASFLIPLFVGNTINDMLGETSFNLYVKLAIAFFAAMSGVFILSRIADKSIINKSAFNAQKKMNRVFYNFISNPVFYFRKRTVGDLISRSIAFNNASLTQDTHEYAIGNAILVSSASLLIMLWIQPLLALTSMVFIIATGLTTKMYMTKNALIKSELEKNIAEQQQFYSETINGIISWKSSNSIKRCFLLFTHYRSSYIKHWQLKKNCEVNQQSMYAFLGGLELLIMLGVALEAMINNRITFGGFYSFVFLRQIAFNSMTHAYLSSIALKENDIINSRAVDLYEGSIIDKFKEVKDTFTQIEIKNLYYGYYNQPRILNGIHLDIVNGDKICLMGASGSGKSSLLLLLSGLDEPSSAKLKINGEIIHQWQCLKEYTYLQTSFDIIFKGSLIDNITMYEENPNIKKCIELLELLALSEKISLLPDGVNTFITDSTSTFSAGERQRILVCRALYSSKPLILFDEPTANLDETNANLVFRAIKQSDKSCIVVTHDSNYKYLFNKNYSLVESNIFFLDRVKEV